MPAVVDCDRTGPAVVGTAEVHETHSAYVFLLGDVAYKMKKPIETDFLDFRTVDSRWTACDREFVLNSRFAPDVYIGIAELTDPGGGPAEPLLKMRRLPDSTRLSTRAAAGDDIGTVVDLVAQTVAVAHRNSPRSTRIDDEGRQSALDERWRNNIRELRTLAVGVLDTALVDELEYLSLRYVAGRAALFDHRISRGRIVDGHGDLLSDDIFCLPDGPRILDCLDFDDRLRFLDGIDDVACLAMDLEFQGRPDAARRLVASYLEATEDDPPCSLIDHYIAYRATVRAKVACLRFHQGHAASQTDALAHMRLALDHLVSSITITLVGGLPGTGKSTVAAALAERTGAVVLSSDVVRKESAGLDPRSPHPSAVGCGLYTSEKTASTYAELMHRAREQVGMGRSVVIDASWNDEKSREHALELAAGTHTDLVELECRTPEHIALERITTRPHGASDASQAVYDAMAGARRPWPSATVIDTSGTIADSLAAVFPASEETMT
ncbi:MULTISPECIES: AAA family ATPase [unclassified Rhodococcus (in: high G+C Gram-positive bacteria)]|uniref:bifunctional aminoglycoside phosphotransferase/ATP-binding protein n=1 Tax=unclassified Rhodococcus (in: high G+C Gram-positive bacteria) TaxID=192944 RepID=UPI000B9B5277|nr:MULTISPECIES: AAA family ATPase [unclassified Rhodococcus (in: high G+C Gram-positive bacteria)]OZE34193.1 AAA family ATPase [Rhodococcus sp. 05-2254-4]OZE51391.1 AAA family ATPase [Rhodococcus sp. 05-2254-3]OZE53041.1 AAA family ATPase [Rhodococcus sp. 05-2254-2]